MLPEDKLESLRRRYHELTDLLCQPNVASDGARFTAFSRERGEVEPLVLTYERYVKVKRQVHDDKLALQDPELRDLLAVALTELTRAGALATLRRAPGV